VEVQGTTKRRGEMMTSLHPERKAKELGGV
jgi:hypothetical protein